MKLKVKIGCDTWKRRIRLKSKVQGSRFEHHCLVGYQQELGDGQGRLKIRNPISAIQRGISLSYPKRCLEHLEPEEFALCTGEQAENRCGTKRLAQLRGSQKVVLDMTSWGGSGGRLGWGWGWAGGLASSQKLQEMPGGRGKRGGTLRCAFPAAHLQLGAVGERRGSWLERWGGRLGS